MNKAQTERQKLFLPNGEPKWIRIYDAGDGLDDPLDRFTVVFTGRYRHKTQSQTWVLGMSDFPIGPGGFCQHMTYWHLVDCLDGKWAPAIGKRNHLGKRIRFQDLPEDCKAAVMEDYLYLWDLFLTLEIVGKYPFFKKHAENQLGKLFVPPAALDPLSIQAEMLFG